MLKQNSVRRFLQITSFFVFILAVALPASAATNTSKPNILVIIADDLGYADVGFNGGKVIQTPNLDRLAKTGVNLTDFRSAPMCSPTRAGFLTGRWPLRFGMMRAVVPPWSKYGLPPAEKTLPELLAEVGYKQRGIIGKWHLGHARREYLPLNHGFTSFYGHYNGAIDYFSHERDGERDWHRNDQTVVEKGYATDLMAAEAVRFIKDADRKHPWFLYLPFNAPHSPFQAKPEDLQKYPNLKGNQRTYAAMVDSMDLAIGKILAAVESRADADNTLILFFSDNGGITKAGSDNGPHRGEKLTVYEGGTRVCAAMRWPKGGVTGGKHFDGRIGYVDILPTVLAAAGMKAPRDVDGVDFLPALTKGNRFDDRPWFSYMHQNQQAHASVHLGDWKLVAHGDFFKAKPAKSATFELYDLNKDRGEKNDVAATNPKEVAKLSKLLREFGSWQKAGVGAYEEGREGFRAPKDWNVQD